MLQNCDRPGDKPLGPVSYTHLTTKTTNENSGVQIVVIRFPPKSNLTKAVGGPVDLIHIIARPQRLVTGSVTVL